MLQKFVFYFFMYTFGLVSHGQASFLGRDHLQVEDCDVLASVDACIEKMVSMPSGDKLLVKIIELWTEYLKYEPKALLKISKGCLRFTGGDTKSPVQSTSTNPGVEIRIKDIDGDSVMKKWNLSCGDKIEFYKKEKNLGEGITISSDNVVTFNSLGLWIITALQEKQTFFCSNGWPRKATFSLDLKKYEDRKGPILGAIFT